jgi:hypothetical protein
VFFFFQKRQSYIFAHRCPTDITQHDSKTPVLDLFRIFFYISHLKVPKCEIFHLFDFNDFYGIKSV